jgi:hypothetical protein
MELALEVLELGLYLGGGALGPGLLLAQCLNLSFFVLELHLSSHVAAALTFRGSQLHVAHARGEVEGADCLRRVACAGRAAHEHEGFALAPKRVLEEVGELGVSERDVLGL